MMGEPYFEILLRMESAIKLKKTDEEEERDGEQAVGGGENRPGTATQQPSCKRSKFCAERGGTTNPKHIAGDASEIRVQYIAVIYWHYGLNSRSDRGRSERGVIRARRSWKMTTMTRIRRNVRARNFTRSGIIGDDLISTFPKGNEEAIPETKLAERSGESGN